MENITRTQQALEQRIVDAASRGRTLSRTREIYGIALISDIMAQRFYFNTWDMNDVREGCRRLGGTTVCMILTNGAALCWNEQNGFFLKSRSGDGNGEDVRIVMEHFAMTNSILRFMPFC